MTEKVRVAFLVCSGVLNPYNMFDQHLEILEYPLIQFGVDVSKAGENIKAWSANILLEMLNKIDGLETKVNDLISILKSVK